MAQLLVEFVRLRISSFTRIRLTFGRYLSLALEFQLASDILSTSIAPSWQEIGKLGATAVIRTALNYFLAREIDEFRERQRNELGCPNRPMRGGTGKVLGSTHGGVWYRLCSTSRSISTGHAPDTCELWLA